MLWAEGSAGMGERGKSVYFWHKTEENYNQGNAPKMSETNRREHSSKARSEKDESGVCAGVLPLCPLPEADASGT